MRRLFLVVAKLLGLLQLYWALTLFVQVGFFFMMPSRPESSQFVHILVNLIGVLAYFVLTFGFAGILLARTEWVADKLGIREENGLSELEKHPALLVGVQLIGVYVTVHAAPALVRELLSCYDTWHWDMDWRFWSRAIDEALQLALGVVLMLRSGKVVEIITKRKQPAAPEGE
jgi:hypothetical protein